MYSKFILLFLFLILATTTVFAQTATAPTLGAGTVASPYQISNINHLYWISQSTTRWAFHYTQTANIDVSASSTWDSGAGFTPIGNSSTRFTGSYTASGRTITGLTINRPTTDNVGLFGFVDGATINSITLVNVSITGRNSVGALAGQIQGNTEISRIHVNSGTVTGVSAGGLIGVANSSTVTLSSAKVPVTASSGSSAIGGLVSQNINGTISTSYATGAVTGSGSTGGLLGWNNGGFVRNTYATGSVSGATSGGLVGLNQYVNASIYGLVEHSYAIGTVTGTTHQGSLIGRHTASSVITQSYFNSSLSGLAGAVGDGSSTGATNLTTDQMRLKASFTGFNFTDNWSMVGDGAYFPTFISNPQTPIPGSLLVNGSGTSGDPFLISNADELNAIRGYSSQHFRLTADIDLTEVTGTSGGKYWNGGAGFIPINPQFNTIKLDGNGHTINGLYMNTTTLNTGLIAQLGSNGYVRNLHLTNINITTTASRVGGIVGSLTVGYVSNSSVTGTITMNNATGRTGGIAGELIGPTSGTQAYVSNTFTNVTLSGVGQYVGGIVGSLALGKSVTDSYAAGSIQNTGQMSGGIAGLNQGTISRTYAIGVIQSAEISTGGIAGINNGTITNSFWNPATTTRANGVGQGTLTGPASLSSFEMRQDASFTGFDFATVWQSNAPNSFPTLRNAVALPAPGYQQVENTSSLSFSGNFASAPHSSVYNDLGAMTVEAWIYPRDLKRFGLIEKHQSPSSGFWIDLNNDITAVFVTANGTRSANSSVNPSVHTWHHFAVVYDGTDVAIFLNGQNVTTLWSGTGSGSISNNTRAIRLGNLNWANGSSYDGLMDDVRIWNVARTADQIRQNMHQPLNGDESGLIAYYPLNEQSGTAAYDRTTNGNTATFSTGVSWSTEKHPFGTFISGTQGWRVMSSPFENASFGTLLEPLWTQGFTGADVTNGASNVHIWNEATRSFTSVSNATDVPAAGAGFVVFVFDDQNYDGTPDGFPKIIRSTAAQRTSNVSPSVSFTDTGVLANDGWNLVGNPYGATINLGATANWSSTNLDATSYVWNAAAGEYQTWNGVTGTLPNGLIAPWQGFWLKANAENPTVSFTGNLRSAGGTLRKQNLAPVIRFTLDGNELQSSAIVMLHEDSNIGKDRYDAYKLQSLKADHISLFTQMNDGTALDIHALPIELSETLSIPLDIGGTQLHGEFELSWDVQSLPNDWMFTIRDNVTGVDVDLMSASSHRFQVMTAKRELSEPQHDVIAPSVMKRTTSDAARFTFTITPGSATSIEDVTLPAEVSLSQNFPNPFNPSTVIGFQLPVQSQVELRVYDMLGREVSTLVSGPVSAGSHQVNFDASNLASGMYIYRLVAGNTVLTKKLTLIK